MMARQQLFQNSMISCLLFSATVKADFDSAYQAFQAGDYETALHEFRLQAEQGEVAAQDNLGVIYQLGNGVRLDDKEGFEMVYPSGAAGDARSAISLRSHARSWQRGLSGL